MNALRDIPADRTVLIAGPTASGKSALALALARRDGRRIVNADALQVFSNWRVLTARPSPQDEALASHELYGHVSGDENYSVGSWLRDLGPLLADNQPPVIVGGTGLYLTALTQGLAEIPEIPPAIRIAGEQRLTDDGLVAAVRDLDSGTRQRIDTANPARVLRAWEVLHATGRGLSAWHDDPTAPLLARSHCHAVVVDAPKEWLSPRIERRFSQMLEQGALEEAHINLPGWDPAKQSSKAIGAPELMAYLKQQLTLDEVREAVVRATCQYAKRQRNWFRARMRDWDIIEGASIRHD